MARRRWEARGRSCDGHAYQSANCMCSDAPSEHMRPMWSHMLPFSFARSHLAAARLFSGVVSASLVVTPVTITSRVRCWSDSIPVRRGLENKRVPPDHFWPSPGSTPLQLP
jgi:hypothetical protein